ncbi:DNA-dependent protein kinase catalytic subunit-like isoform X2 [Harmonia axyridis]|nr:DNA-dependent protein kinase catalytic subunit-like isoform X2 [Harmonia axyridis]
MSLDSIDDKRYIDDLYVIIKKLSQDAFKLRIKVACRAALTFLQKNVSLFSDKIFKEHEFWHKTLSKWLSTLGIEEKKIGSQVILTIYRSVCRHLIEENNPDHKGILKGYLEKFRQMLDKQNSTNLKKQICIHGIKILFKSTPILLSDTEISNFSLKLLHTFRLNYLIQQDYESDDWFLLPDYIQMITSIIVTKKIERGEIFFLKQSLIVLIKHYSHIPILNRYKVNETFLLAIYSVKSCHFFESFLRDLMYQSVIWSCSHQHISELNEDNREMVTIMSYLPFWKGMLNSNNKQYGDDCELSIEEGRLITAQIVEKLITTLLVCVDKLDVSTTYKESNSTSLKGTIQINKKDDFVIFLNIVDFYERLFQMMDLEFFKKYIHKLLNFFMDHSLGFPLISGFYRLLAVCLKIANKLNYFDKNEQNEVLVKTLSSYMHVLLSKMSQYEDELLISCSKVLLECPASIIEEMLPSCVPAFITIFSIGRHYLPVAALGIQTLEAWQKGINHNLMEDFLGKIVYKLDAFLRSKSLAYLAPEFQKSNKSNKVLRKRKMAVEIEPELVKIQRRILRFLGRQTTTVCEKMLDGQRIVSEVWSDVEHLKITLPFPDTKLDIHLDRMVPLLVELALYSSDRKTRVTASELLQGLVVLFLGVSKQMTNKEQEELSGVLKKFSLAILELGCDPDEVIRGLFEPLVLQMIHWYSSPHQTGKCHTAIVLEALIDGASSFTNANLRSFSGKCIGEFVKWTIKQWSEASLQQNPINIKILIRKMRFLCLHPDKFKKLGAALMFNNFYVFLREERSLLNMFWIEIFEIFVSSLHYLEDNFESKTACSQIFDALKHLQRGFIEKASLFSQRDEKRRKPHGFQGTTSIDILKFLADNIGSKNPLCREKCAELFYSLLPCYPEAKNLENVQNSLKDPMDSWHTRQIRFHDMKDVKIEESVQRLSELHRGIDRLIFLLKNGTLTNQDLNNESTVQNFSCYLEFIVETGFEDSINQRQDELFNEKAFFMERNRINKKALILLHSILDFNCKTDLLWCRSLWSLIAFLVFDLENNMKKELECFLKSAVNKMPKEVLEEMKETMKIYLMDNFSDNLDLNFPISSKQNRILNGMVFLKSCHEHFNFSPSLYPRIVQKFLRNCFEIGTKNGSLYLNDEEVSYYFLVLQFGFRKEFEEIGKFLFNPDEFEELEGVGKITIGSFLLNTFETIIIPQLLDTFDEFLELSTRKKENISISISYIKSILKYISRSKKNISWSNIVFNKLCDNWECFKNFFSEDFEKLLEGMELIEMLNSIRKNNSLSTSFVLLIMEKKDFSSSKSSFETRLEILEFLFLNIDSTLEEQYAVSIRAALNEIMVYVSEKSDKNIQNMCLMKMSKLYQILRESRSILLLEFIINLYSKFPDFEQYIKDTIIFQKYVKNLSDEDQMKIMNVLVNHMKNQMHWKDFNMGLGKDIMTMVFQKTSLEAFQSYFLSNIRSIIEELRVVTSQDNLCVKIIDFILVEILFARISIMENNDINQRMRLAALPESNPNSKEFLQCILMCTLNNFRENICVEAKYEELLRICRCHCYNTLVSITVNGLNNANFHVKLFTRMDGNEDILWRSMVDLKKTYKFEKDFNSLPQKKKIVVNIKNFSNTQNSDSNFSGNILRSQRIFNSSLSEDITKHDMSNVTLRSKIDIKNENPVIEMDYIEVNDHECMVTICALIRHLTDTTYFSYEEQEPEIPLCFKALRNVLMNDTTPLNVRIFLIKVIENTSHAFFRYSKWFLAPVMKFIADKCAGDEMNFFISDLVVMLANWSEKSLPQDGFEEDLATKVIQFLFEKLPSERRDIFKYNLELIRILMGAWKNIIHISDSYIASLFTSMETEETDKEVNLISLLLINDLFLFEKTIVEKLLISVEKKLSSSKKSAFMPCSELLGIFLKKWKEKYVWENYEHLGIESMIVKIWETDSDKGGLILEGITINYPEFLQEKHIIRLLSRLGNVMPTSQYVFLKVVLRAIPVLECVNEFRTENWEKYINSESVDVQITSLSLMKMTLYILEKEPIFYGIISSICSKKNSQNELCRKLAFDMIIQISLDHLQDPSKYNNVINLCKDAMLDGLAIENQELLQHIQNFWVNSDELSKNLTERFIQSFSAIYKPKNEDVVLGTGINFFLSLSKLGKDVDEVLFDHPLEDCDFEDYELSVNSTTQHPYEVPMFAETFFGNQNVKIGKNFKFGELRATQEAFSFSATVASKQDEAVSQFLSSQSSLFLDARNVPSDKEDFKNPNDYVKCKVFKKRFLKSKLKISEYCANFEVKSIIKKGQNRVKGAKERDRQVCITRTYRKGDFPDIQIPLSAIVVPLQQLSLGNSDVAKMLYSNIFKKLKEKMSTENWSDLVEAINIIFKNSSEFNTNLFRTLMDFIVTSNFKMKLDPYLITECCLSSSLVSTGTLIIEGYLMHLDEGEPQAKRLKGNSISEETVHWIKLAELYKEMNEWDVVCSIFQNKVPCNEAVRTAISAESRKQWVQARDLYKDVIEKDMTQDKRDFYYEAYFKCIANLGQWQSISDSVKASGPDFWNALWQDDWKQKKMLPWYMTAEVNCMLFKQELSNAFLQDVNTALCENRKAEHLKLSYPEHIALMWMLNDDLDAAEMYLRSAMDCFLSQWQILDPMFRGMRLKKMLKLRNCTTIYEFIDIYRMFGNVEIERIVEHLEILWSNTRYGASYPTMLQESSILHYKQFLSLIHSRITSLDDSDFDMYLEKIKTWKFELDLGQVDAALRDSNFYLARKYLEPHRNKQGIGLHMAKMMLIRSQSPDTMIKSLKMVTDLVEKDCDKTTHLNIRLTGFDILGELSRFIANNEDVQENLTLRIQQIIGHELSESRTFQDYGANLLYQFLEQHISSGSTEISDSSISDAYLKVSYYLIDKEAPDVDVLSKMVLRAMKLGAAEARQLFPILLQQENLGSTHKYVFQQESALVPTWMFLSWVPQLLANMNSDNIYAIDSIIMRISETYPQAIMYAYRLSRENFEKPNQHLSEIVIRMDGLLLNEDLDIFLRALGNVCLPEKKLAYYVEKIRKNLGNSEEIEKVKSFILSEFYADHPDSNEPSCLLGNIFRRIKAHESNFKGQRGDLDKLEELLRKLKGDNCKVRNSLLLKDYCPWLANFTSTKLNVDLEIPGQYNGKKMPLPQYHVKIYKFHPEILVLSSLRKPIKLTILGNDTKEYSYLVKFGEDIRQDQRIEQLLDVMNDIFRKSDSYSQEISLETFEVIPLTSSLGIIRWIDKTLIMETFMRRCLNNKKKSLDGPFEKYVQFIYSSARRINSDKVAYGESSKVHDRNKVILNYQRTVNEIDKDILRKAFWNMSTSIESFIALRHNFMRSYAIMCVSHWILGIGDRHLSNTLICLKSGHVIGIDFGCAFGTATQMLPVPELIPFRLTPQIVSFMEPLEVKGHFRGSMMSAMKCLKENKKLLVAVMSVFIKEPSSNWLEISSSSQSLGDSSSNWYPNHKLNQVKRKLEGINSTEIVLEDLRDGQVKEYLESYSKLVKGLPNCDYRAQIARCNLSVEEQVDCLIDHARDYNLLGRTYAGWRSWV